MKKIILMYFVLFSLLCSSCVKDYSEYTFSGRFVNGTTGLPYKNIQVDFIGRAPGYPSSKVIDLGSAITNDNGEFSLKYSIESNFPGTLSVVFRNPNNPFIDLKALSEQPILQDQYQSVYLSDSLKLVLLFNSSKPLVDDEILHIRFGPEQGFDFTLNRNDLIFLNNKYTVRRSSIGVAVICERISVDTTIIGSEKLNIKGDPYIDSVTINY